MPWVISFIVSWILFFLLIDKSKLKYNVLGGVLALTLASIVDWGGQKLELYTFRDLIIPWFGCSAFYKFGPVFTMGILFSQLASNKKWLQTLNIFAFSSIFLTLERLIILTNVAEYIHWHILASLFVNVLALTSLSWFTMAFLRKPNSKRL